MTTPDKYSSVPAALEAELLLAAFEAGDEETLNAHLNPPEEVVTALIVYTALAIRGLAEAHPLEDVYSIRQKLRRTVVELLEASKPPPDPQEN